MSDEYAEKYKLVPTGIWYRRKEGAWRSIRLPKDAKIPSLEEYRETFPKFEFRVGDPHAVPPLETM